MADIEPMVTFLAGTTLGGLIGYLIRTLIEHKLAKERSSYDRKCVAAREFRAKVNKAIALFNKPEKPWNGNNRTANAMRNFVGAIDLAAKDFAEFFTGSEKKRFIEKWNETKGYCSTTLPRALKSGDGEIADKHKKAFLNHVDELLSYAKTS